jgi:hypothetical protein
MEGLSMEDVGIFGPFFIFYSQMFYFMAIGYILWSSGIFLPFWYAVPRKIWQP